MAGTSGRLAHFLGGVVEAHDTGADHGQARFRHHKRLAVQVVEALGDIARQFHVLALVIPDRDDSGVVEQNVRCHQNRILQQPIADCLGFFGFRFELRHAFEPTEGRDTGQQPAKFGMLRHAGLDGERTDGWVNPGSEVKPGDLANFFAQLFRLLVHRNSVEINDAKNALVFMLQLDPITEGAKVVAYMKVSGRLHPGEDSCFHRQLPVY